MDVSWYLKIFVKNGCVLQKARQKGRLINVSRVRLWAPCQIEVGGIGSCPGVAIGFLVKGTMSTAASAGLPANASNRLVVAMTAMA
jgi:hypothetical protein